MVQHKIGPLGVLHADLEEAAAHPGPASVGRVQCDLAGVMLYVVCKRCHDSHRILRIYSSPSRARAMAELGNRLEVSSVTRRYIAFARAAQSDEERDHWAREMLQVRADGLARWLHYVQEVQVS